MTQTFSTQAAKQRRWSALLSAVVLCLITAPALATTVLQLSFPEVVDSAELIFEGHVSKVESIQTGPRSIHTKVTFEIISVIKGTYPDAEISLQFLGGEVDGRRLVVQGMQVPEQGETGIFFVQSLQETLIHPLVGWSQGHFLLETDARGEHRVLSAEHAPVTGIALAVEPQADTLTESQHDALPLLGDDGAARGVIVDHSVPAESAMSADEFRGQLQSILDIQRQVP